MAILRTITIAVTSSDVVTKDVSFAGYEGEHLATDLAITVPASWDTYTAYVSWRASDGWLDESPAYLIANPASLHFHYQLPQAAMKKGPLYITITARKTIDVDNTFTAHTANLTLNVSASVNADPTYATDFLNAIQDHEERLNTLEGGTATANGITSAGVIEDNHITRGDGGTRGIQSSTAVITDVGDMFVDGYMTADNLYTYGTVYAEGDITSGTDITAVGKVEGATGHFGGATHYSEFEADGTYRAVGDATVWDDFVVKLGNLKAPASDPPSTAAYKGSELYSFSKTATNILYFEAQIPHSYKEGSNLEFHIHVAYPTNGAGNSRWTFTYSWANRNEAFPAQTSVSVTLPAPAILDKHVLHEIVASIDGAGKTISSELLCSISRIGGDGADTYDSAIHAISGDFHFEKDTIGSRTQTTK